MTFVQRPYDPNREDKRTDAQRAATDRNFHIFKLRGLWQQARLLMEPYRTATQALIDADLRERGALPQRDHEREAARKRAAKRAKEHAQNISDFDEIPF